MLYYYKLWYIYNTYLCIVLDVEGMGDIIDRSSSGILSNELKYNIRNLIHQRVVNDLKSLPKHT
jgi:hypothetical protein